tara:strand:+ start:369 stop:1214 length:846 start_codon:yes stop_codon:yes gene_type:complete
MLYAFNIEHFENPVDTESLGIHDYHEIISEPMDMNTLTNYCDDPSFTFTEWLRKARLIWLNALTYNPSSNKIHQIAATLSQYMESLINVALKHDKDDCTEKLYSVYYSMISHYTDDKLSDIFVDIDIDNDDYYEFCSSSMGINDILTLLNSNIYQNRYDLEYDLLYIFSSAINYYGLNTVHGISAYTLHQTIYELLNAKHSDMESTFYIDNEQRMYVHDIIAYKLTDENRLQIANYISSLSCHACHGGKIKCITLDFLNIQQFINVSMFLRKLLVEKELLI